jgi:hypothetical protein
MPAVRHLSREELEAGLATIRQAPADHGVVELIACRPRVGERKQLDEAELDLVQGLIGDGWRLRGHPEKDSYRDTQLTIMNARAAALVAQARDKWSLAGDQLYIDLDLSNDNLPPGTRLAIGTAVVEVTAQPHTGCKNFVSRFGLEAMKFVNSAVGRQLNLRGINTRVVVAGTIRVGDVARKDGVLVQEGH